MKAAAAHSVNNRYHENLSCLGLLDLGEGRGTSVTVQQIVTCQFLALVLYSSIQMASSIVTNISKKRDVS
jgi:hypothetical protein